MRRKRKKMLPKPPAPPDGYMEFPLKYKFTGQWVDHLRPIEWVGDVFAEHMDKFDSFPREIRDQINEGHIPFRLLLGWGGRRGRGFTWRKPRRRPKP